MLLFFNFLIICCISSTAIGSIPAKGSSSKIKSGFKIKALAISVLLLSPPDRCLATLFLLKNHAIALQVFEIGLIYLNLKTLILISNYPQHSSP